MGRTLFLGAFVALLCGLLFMLLGRDEEASRDTATVGPRSDEPAQQQAPVELNEPAAGGESSALVPGLTGVAAGGERVAVEGPLGPAAGATPSTLELTLVQRDDRAPVVGARVRWFHSSDSGERARFLDPLKIDELLEKRGRELASDAGGVVRVPVAKDGFSFVAADIDGWWGTGFYQAGSHAPRELELDRDGSLRVRVVQTGGVPAAGASVALRALRGRQRDDRVHATTGADGRVVLPHVCQAIRRRGTTGGVWAIAVDAPTVEPVARELDPENLPIEEIVLELPTCGSVVVVISEVDGEPFRGEGEVSLAVVPEGEGRQASVFSDRDRNRAARAVTAGQARFDWVPTGFDIELRANREGSKVHTKMFVPGPTQAEETLEVGLQLGSTHPVLLFRLVDIAGQPLADVRVHSVLEHQSKHLMSSEEGSVETDGSGRCLVDLNADWLPDTTRALSLFVGKREAPERLGRVDLSRNLQPGLHDFGDLVLGPPPVFVRGQVVDVSGAGVAGATLRLERERGEGSLARWAEVWDFRQRADDEGHFEVQGGVEGERFRLSVRHEGYASAPAEFVPGDTLRILAEKAGELPGSVLVDEGVRLRSLQVQIESEDRESEDRHLSWRDARKNPDPEGHFRFKHLRAGAYTVRVTIDGNSEPLAEISEIFVRAGGETLDPRLQGIDLRGRLTALNITLRPPTAGQAISGQLQFRETGNPEAAWKWHHFRDADITILSPFPVVDIAVNAEGYRLEKIDGVRGDTFVDLRRGLSVRLVLRGGARLPPPPICIKAALIDDTSSNTAIDWGAACFDESRETRVQANGSGRMRVQWVVERSTSGSAVAMSPPVEPTQYVQVIESDVEQTVEIDLTQAQMDELVQMVGG